MSDINLFIDDLGAQGDGIAHHDGKTIFVAGALPREKIRAEIISQGRAKILDIKERSPERAAPACPHFESCGGCSLQHLNPELYTKFKTQQLRNTLEHAGIPLPVFAETIVTPPRSRRRARLVARHMKSGLVLGFNEMRSHKIIDIQDCALLCPPLMKIIPTIREQLKTWLPLNKSCDIQLTALPTGIDMVLIGGPKLDLENREKLGAVAQTLCLARLSWRETSNSEIEPISIAGQLTISFGKTTLPFPSDSFIQASDVGEKSLTYFIHKYIKPNMSVLDLFCGLGTFGLSLESLKQLLMADIDGPATDILEYTLKGTARANVERRNLFKEPFSSFECDDFDCIIFDPPRAGAKTQSKEIAESSVPLVLAISCNPTSFARDAMTLIKGGYKLTALQPIDQFLWSTHIELAACFEK